MSETASSAPQIAFGEPVSLPIAAASRRILGSRGRLVRRLLLAADLGGAVVATAFAGAIGGVLDSPARAADLLLLPLLWPPLATLEGLYERDESRAGHSTVDDLSGVIHVASVVSLVGVAVSQLAGVGWRDARPALVFWPIAIVAVTACRGMARAVARRSDAYVQRTLIVGADEVGQLLARKITHHPEYGMELVGFADSSPQPLRSDLDGVEILGGLDALAEIVARHRVDRVLVAYAGTANGRLLERARFLRARDVQVDVVPRLFELVGPNVELHALEGLPLLGLPTARISRSSAVLKRALDVAGAGAGLVLAAPLMLAIAIRIRLDSPGPVLFRQVRLGANMREFTILKFRTMSVGTDPAEHRSYIRAVMNGGATPTSTGIYKLARDDAVTGPGRWLRRTSLDELPQLLNVLRGEMSLVGPRPCIPYETENFEPHHFERFLVPAGITGLWQVTARAHATYGEALDMDVGYARGWSLSLDLLLILRTVRYLAGRRGRAVTA